MTKVTKIILAASLMLIMAPASAQELTDEQKQTNEEILHECYFEVYPEMDKTINGETLFYQSSPLHMDMCKKRKGYLISQNERDAKILRNCFYKIRRLIEPRDWSDELFNTYSVYIVICMKEKGHSSSAKEANDE